MFLPGDAVLPSQSWEAPGGTAGHQQLGGPRPSLPPAPCPAVKIFLGFR